jgi:hypothetical protein
MKMTAFLRDATWLHRGRARAYAAMLSVAIGLTLLLAWDTVLVGHPPFMPAVNDGLPGGTDFLSFWSAGRLALGGEAGAPYYDQARLAAVEHGTAYIEKGASLAFFYPPVFLLFCVPLALLPYLPSFALFTAVQAGLLLAALRRLVPQGWGWLPVLGFPGLLVNAAVGQNGFFSAAAFAGAALWLDRAPVLAGACLGLLVFKPHLALAAPVALLAARRFSALFACAATAVALIGLSVALFGVESWRAFIATGPMIQAALEVHPEDWRRLLSVHTAVRELRLGLPAAYAAQTVTALAALGVLAWFAARRPDGRMLAALMVGATLLVPPHLLDYDVAAEAVPLLVIAAAARRGGWLPWEKSAAGAAYLLPLLGRLATDGMVPIGPPILIGLFAIVCRRALLAGGTHA